MSDIFLNDYWQGNCDARTSQQAINNKLATGVSQNAASIDQTNVRVTTNANNIATLQQNLNTLSSTLVQTQSDLSDLSSRVTRTQSANADALAGMNQTLAAFQKQVDGYSASISAASSAATQAQTDVAAIKNYADPDLIKTYMAQVDAFGENIPVQVKAEFNALWTPAQAEMLATINAISEQIGAVQQQVSKNTAAISANATQAAQDLQTASDAWAVMARSLQGQINNEKNARCETDKALYATIENNDKKQSCNLQKVSDDLDELTKTVADNKAAADTALTGAKQELSDQTQKVSDALAASIVAQGKTDATQNGAIETNRQNIADLKTNVDTFDNRITNAEKNAAGAGLVAQAAAKDAAQALTTANGFAVAIEAATQTANNAEEIAKAASDDVASVAQSARENAEAIANLESLKTDVEKNAQDIDDLTSRVSGISDDGKSAAFPAGVVAGVAVMPAPATISTDTAGGSLFILQKGDYVFPQSWPVGGTVLVCFDPPNPPSMGEVVLSVEGFIVQLTLQNYDSALVVRRSSTQFQAVVAGKLVNFTKKDSA